MLFDFTLKTLRLVLNLHKKYINNAEKLTASEYIEQKISEKNLSDVQGQLLYNFIRHDDYLLNLVVEYWKTYNLPSTNRNLIAFLMYVIIFEFEQKNLDQTIKFFNDTYNIYKLYYRVPMFFEREDCLIIVARLGCEYFDQSYVLENILYAIYDKYKSLIELISQIEVYMLKTTTKSTERIIQSKAPSCMTRQKQKVFILEKSSQETIPPFTSKEPPTTTYVPEREIGLQLEKEYQKNWNKALRLLELARTDAFRCAITAVKMQPKEPPPKPAIKHKKPPPIVNVEIKTNASYYLRQAATLAKGQINELKQMEDLTSGSSYCNFQEIEEETRKEKQQQLLQEVERKHLQGLLTREEAILAKQNLIKQNQEKMEQFKIEHEEILQEIETWKKEELEKLKQLVEKGQNIFKAAREAEKQLLLKKQENAKSFEEENRKLLNEAYKRKQEELTEKVKLIQEIRALNQLKQMEQKETKEFDPTDCPNFGLMCEMSIAELRERLTLVKIDMKETLEKRKRAIAEQKTKHNNYMDKVKEFITQSKQIERTHKIRTNPITLQETPEILSLRQKLQRAKKARLNSV